MRKPKQLPDYQTEGDTPSAAAGRHLLADPLVTMSNEREQLGREAAIKHNTPEPPPPITAVRQTANEVWEPLLIALPTLTAVELLGRDRNRETVDIANQSLLISGVTAVLYLFGTQREAESFCVLANRSQALTHGIRCLALPEGTGRTFTHNAPVWAVATSAGAFAVVDVSVERKSARA